MAAYTGQQGEAALKHKPKASQATRKPNTADSAYIAPFWNDMKAAVTYTFDDGIRCQYTRAIPVLDELGFKGTFFVIPGCTPATVAEAEKVKSGAWGGVSWEEWKRALANGHEIGNHSLKHKKFTELNDADVLESVEKSQELFKAHLDMIPLTFCYPYNRSDDRVKAIVEPRFPFRREKLKGIGGKQTAQDLNLWIDDAIKKGQWAVAMIHGIEAGYARFVDPKQLFDHWRYAKTRESDIWVDTFAAIASYKAVAESVKLEVNDSENQVTCNFKTVQETAIKSEKPLTIVIPAKGARSAKATQGPKSLTATIMPEKILINVYPDDNPVKVSWN